LRSWRAERAILLQTLRRFLKPATPRLASCVVTTRLASCVVPLRCWKRQVPSSQCQTTARENIVLASQARPCPISSSPIRPNSHPPQRAKALVEADGIEPTTPCLQSRCSPTELRPLALPAHDVPQHTRAVLVGPGRFELPTSRLSSARSNQLSYEPGSLVSPHELGDHGSRKPSQAQFGSGRDTPAAAWLRSRMDQRSVARTPAPTRSCAG
jgi:hypothetical protein